ncbi:uncharacterized protein LOC135388272 [Ornithodoros turicata]|uniref:uncharacterized protein LOC135388272 n=1 Tax=Ornithodoros turicata TaxID=34597 RepID=UPI00313890DD
MYRPSEAAPFKTTHDVYMDDFTTLIGKFSTTRCGIDIREAIRPEAMAQLNTTTGVAATRSLYAKQVFHYSTLDFEVTVNTTSADVGQLINFLLKLGKIQLDNKKNSRNFGYLFVGVSPVGRDSGNTMRDHVQRIINEGQPDGILFLTTYLREPDDVCRVAAPSVWTKPAFSDQPTFVHSLDFRRRLHIPKKMTQLLSLTPHGRFSTFFTNRRPTSDAEKKMNFDLLLECGASTISSAIYYTCKNSGEQDYHHFHNASLTQDPDVCDPIRLSRLIRSPEYELYIGYDSVRLMKLKICKAHREYGYQGGWVVFDLQLGDLYQYCFEPKRSFGFVRAVRTCMDERRSSCESVDSACTIQDPSP